MNEHTYFKELILLERMNELNDDKKQKLNAHILTCKDCAAEAEKVKELLEAVSSAGKEINDDLLHDARMQLRGALRRHRNSVPFHKDIAERFKSFFTTGYSFAYAGAAMLLIGLFIGYLFFYTPPGQILNTISENNNQLASPGKDGYKIANVRLVNQDMDTKEIEFAFDIIKPVSIKGGFDDENIKNILMFTILNEENPGLRFNSINLLSNTQPAFRDSEVKTALITVVKYDDNPGVKLEALKTLKQYQYDDELKDAFLYVLMNDTSTGMRIEAINALVEAKKEGTTFDGQDLTILEERMKKDENNYIRYFARTVLEEYK